MTVLNRSLILAFWLGMAPAYAADGITLDRVKTGILPSGGFYSLYEGACADRNVVSVASLDRMRRWCINASGELACVREPQEAVQMACARNGLASTRDADTLETLQ
jgi:hypothetical protein